MAQHGPKMSPRWPQDDPKTTPIWPKISARYLQIPILPQRPSTGRCPKLITHYGLKSASRTSPSLRPRTPSPSSSSFTPSPHTSANPTRPPIHSTILSSTSPFRLIATSLTLTNGTRQHTTTHSTNGSAEPSTPEKLAPCTVSPTLPTAPQLSRKMLTHSKLRLFG